MSRDGFVTLGSQLTPEEAGMAKGLLEEAGLAPLVEDQNLSSVDPLVRLAIGGAKLLVPAADEARARALLDEAGVLAPASALAPGPEEVPEEEWAAGEPPTGPEAEPPRFLRSGLFLTVAVAFALAVASAILGMVHRYR